LSITYKPHYNFDSRRAYSVYLHAYSLLQKESILNSNKSKKVLKDLLIFHRFSSGFSIFQKILRYFYKILTRLIHSLFFLSLLTYNLNMNRFLYLKYEL